MLKDNNAELPYQTFSRSHLFRQLVDDVFYWGLDRNITAEGGATSLSQIKKLKEEAGEIEEALLKGDDEEAKLEIGDNLVVLLQICRLKGFDLVECLEGAYNKIKDRKGYMKDGVFVKQS